MSRYTHCDRCGGRYEALEWPRVCGGCSLYMWRPIHPVAVVLIPVTGSKDGVLVGRRDINPGKGMFALPGGFSEFGEIAEDAARRELFEETGLQTGGIRFSHTFADDAGHFLIFFHGDALDADAIMRDFVPSDECPELMIATEPMELAFESHTEAMRSYFENRWV